MATSTITNTITGPTGTAVEGATIVATLKPGPGFRISDSSEIAARVTTTTDSSGDWSLSLERQSNISPADSTWWEIEEQIPDAEGGARVWAISVPNTNSTLYASLTTPVSPDAVSLYLTRALADALYGTSHTNLPIYYAEDPLYGAVGDGVTDDTAAWNAALAAAGSAGGGIVAGCPGHTYLVSSSLAVASNTTMLLWGCTFKAALVSWADTGLILINGKTDVVVEGGTLNGQKASNATGGVRGVWVRGSSARVTLRGVRSINMPPHTIGGGSSGYGFMVGSTGELPVDVTLDHCIADGNEQNGLAIVSGQRINVDGGRYINTSGTNPGCGIDVEPNQSNDTLDDVVISGVHFDNNNLHVSVDSLVDGAVSIDDCKFRTVNSGGSCAVLLKNGATSVTNSSFRWGTGPGVWCRLGSGHVVDGNQFFGDQTNTNQRSAVRVMDSHLVKITDNHFDSTYVGAILISQSIGGSSVSAVYGFTVADNTFKDCVVAGDTTGVVTITSPNPTRNVFDVKVQDNVFYDTRSSGDEANKAIDTTALSAAEVATYTCLNNRVQGLAAIYAGVITRDQLASGTSSPQLALDDTPADGDTVLYVKRNVGSAVTLQKVSMGIADSGGANFKLLRVPN